MTYTNTFNGSKWLGWRGSISNTDFRFAEYTTKIGQQTIKTNAMVTVDINDAKYNSNEAVIPVCTYSGRFELYAFNIYQADGILHAQLANISDHDVSVSSESYVKVRVIYTTL